MFDLFIFFVFAFGTEFLRKNISDIDYSFNKIRINWDKLFENFLIFECYDFLFSKLILAFLNIISFCFRHSGLDQLLLFHFRSLLV